MEIRTGARAKDLDVFTKWHTAYHGTFAESVASILRAGNIFSAGMPYSFYHVLILN